MILDVEAVVDASVALKWFVDEEGADAARGLVGGWLLVAPELIVAEVCNGLWAMERRGRLPERGVGLAVERFPRYFARIFPTRPLAPRAVALARQLAHPVYDCFYLTLAEARDAVMVTADRRLVGRVAGTPFAARVRHLVDLPT